MENEEKEQQIKVMVSRLYEAFGKPCNAVTHSVWAEALKDTPFELFEETYGKTIKGDYGAKPPSTAEFLDHCRELKKQKNTKINGAPTKTIGFKKTDNNTLKKILDTLKKEVLTKPKPNVKKLPHHGVNNGLKYTMTFDDQNRCYVEYKGPFKE